MCAGRSLLPQLASRAEVSRNDLEAFLFSVPGAQAGSDPRVGGFTAGETSGSSEVWLHRSKDER